ncbi:translocation protein Sec62-domain-containing protein [Gaertneriomyces semiglobifer]|nr:translocation protein Sec62-domain-containing protein [Gaertneriomyces semiglobifer]
MSDPFKDVPQDIKAVADFLRGGESKLKVRQGVLNGRRVDYFKGKHAVNAILREPYRKKQTKLRPQVSDRPGGEELLTRLFTQKFFVKVQKASKSKQLELVPQPVNFEPESYYAWVYEGSQLKGILIGTGVLLVTFAGVMFPLWPTSLRMGVYYLSLGLLGLMGVFLGIVVVRLLIWLSLKVSTGRDGWLFPNLFEDVGIIDSFIPTWG